MEDEELARATGIGLSLQSDDHRSKAARQSNSPESEIPRDIVTGEIDRQERVGQATPHASTITSDRPCRTQDDDDDPLSSKQQNLDSESADISPPQDLFWDGEVRQTFNQYSQPREDGRPTFRISEVIGDPSEVAFAIISSFIVDVGWISRSFNPETPVILVTQPGPEGKEAVFKLKSLQNWVITTPYLAEGYGCFHMKFMLLFYKTSGRLRVVISSANLVDYEWCEVENTIWLQDFPPLEAPNLRWKSESSFAGSLQYILDNVHVKPALERLLRTHTDLPIKTSKDVGQKWDFGRVGVRLVASISGKHEGWDGVVSYGLLGVLAFVLLTSLCT